ncbi:MAG: DUF45 domain-containing protein [Clostridia bacterium]|nr:DUF45 domain-containing protein [Clostridia bacterium]
MKIAGYEVKVIIRANARRMLLRCRATEGLVTITVPRGTTEKQIRDMVLRHLPWIAENMGATAQWQPAFAAGERHWCLGRLVTLGKDAPVGEAAYMAWRNRQLSAVIRRLLGVWIPRLQIPAGWLRRVTLRQMSSRWGSCCAAKGTLNFSTKLGVYSEELIALTVVHELCHYFHQNHSSAFWALMKRCMPDWEAKKKRRESLDVRPLPPA